MSGDPAIQSIPKSTWLLAQLGRKRGARTTLALLPTENDLPGTGWMRVDQRTWRTGVVFTDAGRAGESAFHQECQRHSVLSKSTLSAVALGASGALTSTDDARAAIVADITFGGNPRFRGKITSQGEVAGIDVAASDLSRAFEYRTVIKAGDGISRILTGCALSFDYALGMSSESGDIPWQWIQAVADEMVRKVLAGQPGA